VGLGNCAEEVAFGVVFRRMGVGVEVTMVEPNLLVVVKFQKELDDVACELVVITAASAVAAPRRGKALLEVQVPVTAC